MATFDAKTSRRYVARIEVQAPKLKLCIGYRNDFMNEPND